MHSRIFQVSLKPINESDYKTEFDYIDVDSWFLRSIADYVNDNTDRDDDIDWLISCVQGIDFGKDEFGEYFIIRNKCDYFERSFIEFKDTMLKMNCTLEEFSKGLPQMYLIQNAYNDEYGFYADVDGELLTFDSFIRLCVTDEKYYIGKTIDYHY